MVKIWLVGTVVCFLLCVALILSTRRYEIHNYPIWYDVFLGILAGVMCSMLSWVGVVFLLMISSLPRND